MGINRLFLGAFNTKVFGEKIKEKHDKAFHAKVLDELLQEENIKLVQLVRKMEKEWNTENLCRKYDLKEKFHSPSGE